MIDAAIFDMDGLMVDSERIWLAQWPSTAEAFGLPFRPEAADRIRGTARKEGIKVVEEVYRDFMPFDADALLQLLHDKAYAAMWEHPADAKPGLYELMNYLAGWHIPRAVASSSSLDLIRHNMAHLHLDDAFQELVSTKDDHIPHSKPAPDIFLETAHRLGSDPSRTLVLEDSYSGVTAGAAGGFITVMVPDLSPVTDEMRHLASFICQDLSEVADLLDEGIIDA